MDKLWHIHMLEYCTAVKKEWILPHITTSMNLIEITFGKRSHTQKSIYYRILFTKQFIHGDRDHSMSYLWGVSTARGHKGTSWGVINILYLFLGGGYIKKISSG